ncbi:MAG: protein kinase [archaeon]|nr:protein kinase [archaeon]
MRLDLSFNRIDTLPRGLFSLKRLSAFDVSQNHLVSVQEFECNSLVSLKFLDLSFNKILFLPTAFLIEQLEFLFCQNNLLKIVPPSWIPQLSHLKDFNFDKNPILDSVKLELATSIASPTASPTLSTLPSSPPSSLALVDEEIQWPIVRTMIFGCGSTAQDQTSTYLIRKFASMLDRGSSSLQDVSTPSASEPDVIGWGRLASHFPSTPSVDITVQHIKIGRAKHCDVILEDTAVSSEHCEIVLELSGQKVDSAYCVDNSSNGTFINGKLIGKGNRKPLRSNDMISLCFPFSLENPLLPAAFTFSFFPAANIRQFLEASTKSETKQTRAVFCGIERCTIDVSSDLSVELIDFGGRPLWSPVLQFFLQPRAIYVITCNPASPSWQTDVEQALRQLVLKASLELRSPTALIAALHPEDMQEEQKRGLLQELQSARIFNTFSRVIKGRALVCPHTGDGIPALWDLILEQIKKSSKIVQPMVSSRWSLFSHILGHLRRHQCSSVSWGAFQDLLSGCRIDPQDYARVSAFFSETGSILLTRTDSLVIVDLPWIAGLMAMLVNEKRISSELQEGIVMHEELHEIWPHLDQQPREAVVALLARLEVVFSLRPLDRGIFVHLRLPSSSPSESEIAKLWPNGSTQFHRVYKFGFVPMRLFSRLLVRLYHVKRLEPKLVWQRGFIGGSSVVMLFVSYDETRNVLEARSRSLVEEAPVTPFLELIYLIDFLLEDIYPRALDQIERFAVCSHCLTSMHPKPSQFPLSALLVKFSRSGADAQVVCHSQILTPNFLPQDSDLAHLLEVPTPSDPSSTSAPAPASTMPAPTSAIPVSASISGSISGFSAAPPSALSLTTILPHTSIPSCHLHPAPDSSASSLPSTLRPGPDMTTSRTRAKSGGFGRILRKFGKQDPFHASLDIDISGPSTMIHAGHIGVDSQSGTMVVSSSELLSLVSQVSHAPVTVDSSTAAAAAMLTTVAATTAAQLHKIPVPLVSIAPDLVLPNLPRSGALQFGEELGVGGFGRVVKATNAAGTFVAVKEMLAMSQQQNNNSQSCSSTTVSLSGSTTNISDDTSSFSCDELASLEPLLTAMNGFLQESFVHGLLSHPNIVAFNGLFHHEDRLGMVLEFVSSGDLQNLLEPHRKASLLHSLAVTDLDRLVQVQVGPEEGSPPISVHIEEEQSSCYVIRTDTSRILVPKSAVRPSDRVPFTDAQLPWTFRIKMALDIAAAMHYLQQQSPPIIHRDLRSPNVFVRSVDVSRASDPDFVHLKLADFGLARPVYSPLVGGLLPTFQWLAPEVIDTAALLYDEKSDIYSFGVVLWEIASRAVPFYSDYWTQFQTNGEFQKHLCIRAILKEDLRPKILDSTPPAFASLIQACWAHHPSARPPFEDIVPYLKRLLKASSDHLPLPHFRKKAHRQR